MKSKRKRTKRTRSVKRPSKLVLKLRSWGNYIDEAFQLETILAKKPARLQIEFVGPGEIPADSALLMRSMILKRSERTRIVTHVRSSLQGATVLIWLLGDTRLIGEGEAVGGHCLQGKCIACLPRPRKMAGCLRAAWSEPSFGDSAAC